jgi:hypothetical protein
MPWTLHLQPVRQPWTDSALLTCGRALYVAQTFEKKCQSLVRFGEMAGRINADPAINLVDLIAQTPADQLLARTLARLGQLLPDAQAQARTVLAPAREARNYIAHECADFEIHIERVDSLLEKMIRLRAEVANLAAGDNLISTWLHQVTERKESTPSLLIAAYPKMIDDWIFGPVLPLLEQQV